MEALEPPVFNTFGLPRHVAFSWLVMVALVVLGLAAARRPHRPRGPPLPAADRHARPLHLRVEPPGARARVHRADRQREHDRRLRDRRVLLVPLHPHPAAPTL